MGGIFRITKAEFTKIFKKPSVYIMGTLLAVVITVSLFVFSPANRITYSVNFTGNSVNAIYNEWSNGIKSDAKVNLDTNISSAKEILSYYGSIQEREVALKTALDEFLAARFGLESIIVGGGSAGNIEYTYTEMKEKLNNLISAYTSDTGLEDQTFYKIYKDGKVYERFYSSSSETGLLNSLLKVSNDSSGTAFNTYYKTNEIEKELVKITNPFITDIISENIRVINSHITKLDNIIKTSSSFTFEPGMEFALNDASIELKNLKSFLVSLNETTYPIVLVNEVLMNNSLEAIDKATEILADVNNVEADTLFLKYKTTLSKYNSLNALKTVETAVANMKSVKVDESLIEKLNAFIDEDVESIKNNLIGEIESFKLEKGASILTENKNAMNDLLTKYKLLNLNTKQYVYNSILINIFNDYSPSEIIELKGYSDFNLYKTKEENVKIDYLVETETFNQEYTNVFSYNQNSSMETTAFDFMFFALKISTIVIVFFAIIMSSNILAFEFDTGTIKLLAIRPFKRYKILLGKLFAVMFFVLVFILFSGIISFAAGASKFAINLTPVLGVFNASFAYVISPITLMIINMIAILLEVFFYTALTLSLSVLFRSFAGSLSTSLVSYIIVLVLNAVFSTSIWYGYIPFLNTDFFRFFGGTFNNPLSTGGLNAILNSGILTNANFVMSLLIYSLFTFVMTYMAYLIFKKRDI